MTDYFVERKIYNDREFRIVIDKNFDDDLPSNIYRMVRSHGMPSYEKIELSKEKLIDVGGVGAMLIEEIQAFLDLKPKFEASAIPHKRGFLLYGDPGTGKSSVLRLAEKAFLKATEGYVLIWTAGAGTVDDFYWQLRAIEPNKPIMVIAEDIDTLAHIFEEAMLEFLDGQKEIRDIVVVATTNHIDAIPDRLKKRPSRIDRVIKIDVPSAEERRIYLDSFQLPSNVLMKLVDHSTGMTFAQTKELFIATQLFGKDVGDARKLLMTNALPSGKSAGFGDEDERQSPSMMRDEIGDDDVGDLIDPNGGG